MLNEKWVALVSPSEYNNGEPVPYCFTWHIEQLNQTIRTETGAMLMTGWSVFYIGDTHDEVSDVINQIKLELERLKIGGVDE